MSHKRFYGNLSFGWRNFAVLTEFSVSWCYAIIIALEERMKMAHKAIPSRRAICSHKWDYSDTLRGISMLQNVIPNEAFDSSDEMRKSLIKPRFVERTTREGMCCSMHSNWSNFVDKYVHIYAQWRTKYPKIWRNFMTQKYLEICFMIHRLFQFQCDYDPQRCEEE